MSNTTVARSTQTACLVTESEGFSPENFRRVMEGSAAVMIARNFISHEDCETLTRNYANYPLKDQRESVPARSLGPGIFDYNAPNYAHQVNATMADVASMFIGTSNPLASSIAEIQRTLSATHVVRPALVLGHPAGSARFVDWQGDGKLALAAHVDVEQHYAPLPRWNGDVPTEGRLRFKPLPLGRRRRQPGALGLSAHP